MKTDRSETILFLLMLAVSNAAFGAKYLNQVVGLPLLFGAVFSLCYTVLLYVLFSEFPKLAWLFLPVVVGVVVYSFVSPPGRVWVDRWDSVDVFWNSVLKWRQPYCERTFMGHNISALPFQMLALFPLWLLKIGGLSAIVAIVIMFFLGADRQRLILLVFSLPFFWEILVKSDIFFNASLVFAFFAIWLSGKKIPPLILGIFFGFVICTRIVYAVLVPPVLLSVLRNDGPRFCVIMFFGVAAGFLCSMIPFVIIDFRGFINYNPILTQSLYTTTLLSAIFLLLSIFLVFLVRRQQEVVLLCSFLVFAIAVAHWVRAAIDVGFLATIVSDEFDISYLIFSLPLAAGFELNMSDVSVKKPKRALSN